MSTDADPLPVSSEPASSSDKLKQNPNQPRKTRNLVQMYKLRVVNQLSYQEISKALGVPKSSVYLALRRLNRVLPDPELPRAFEAVKPQLLSAVEERLLTSLIDEEAIKKSSLNNRAYAFQQVFTANRLSTGASTQNISVLSRLVEEANANPFERNTSERT